MGLRFAPTGAKKHAGAKRLAGRSVSMTRTAIAWKHCIFMPEAGKVTLKAQIAEEVAHIRKVRPDLQLVADAAADNWTFLERLQPDERAFLPCMRTSQRRRRPSQPIGTTSTVPSCATMPTVGHSGDPPSSRQGDDCDGTQGSRTRTQVFPEAQAPHALRGPECHGLHDRVGCCRSRQQGAGQPAHETGALEHAVRTSSPSGH